MKTWLKKQRESIEKWFKKKPKQAPGNTNLVSGLSLGKYVYIPLAGLILYFLFFANFSWLRTSFPTISMPPNWVLGVLLMVVPIGLLLFYRKKLPRTTGKGIWGYFSKTWPVVRAVGVGFLIFWLLLYIAHHTYTTWTWNVPQSTTVPVHIETASPRITITTNSSNHKKLRLNKPQLLKAGTTYVWDKKCKTYYYFEPVNNESTTLSCVDQNDSRIAITGIIYRNSDGADFDQTSGGKLLDEGLYNVTVDRDIMVNVRTRYVGKRM